MEKQPPKLKNKILKYLPKAASVAYFHNPPFSPGRDKRSDSYFHHRVKPHVAKGFSGPIISIIPHEARRKTKNGGGESTFYTQEPTSPKISCMGQIKHKKKTTMNKNDRVQETKPVSSPQIKKHGSTIKKLFGDSSKPEGRRRSDASVYDNQPLSADSVDRAPCLSQMKRFASGRDTFVNFDWSAQVAPVESDHWNYYSDEDEEIHRDDEEDTRIPFSAPIMVGTALTSMQPRKEINLWKRRTMDPPKPLQLNLMVGTT